MAGRYNGSGRGEYTSKNSRKNRKVKPAPVANPDRKPVVGPLGFGKHYRPPAHRNY